MKPNAFDKYKKMKLCTVIVLSFWIFDVGIECQEVQFVEVSAQAGIDFVHVNGASGRKYEVETMGPGCGLFDYDGDGYLDIYLINGAPLPGYQTTVTPTNRLYRNDGEWRFTDVTAVSATGDPGYGLGCAVGDYNNDGDLDLYVTNFGPNVLYRNAGNGTFADVTARAGVGDERWGSTATFLDYDRDGDLDLYLVNYIDCTLKNDRDCRIPGTTTLGYCHPDIYPGVPDVLYRNEGDGTFTDVTRESGIYRPGARGLGVVGTDYDNDGDLDIYVANDSMENYLFANLDDGTFEEIALLSGVSFNEMGHAEAGMGVDIADVDGNGYSDILIGHLSTETNTLYLNNGDETFTDATKTAGLASTLNDLTFGLVFLDADNDGDADAFAANGHVLDNIELISDESPYKQRNKLFENTGNGQFTDASARFGPGLSIFKSSRGTAAGDIDNDGDIDLLVANVADRPDLLRNEGGNRNNWLMVRLIGGGSVPEVTKNSKLSNRDGIGTRVTVISGDLRQVKEVHSAASYQSANDLRLHFGLGMRKRIDLVEVRWPSGRVDRIEATSSNKILVIKEGEIMPIRRTLD